MKLLVGLGNPGREYESTPHNVGFRVIDELAQRFGLGTAQTKFQSEFFRQGSGDDALMLMKPQTFMNRSGFAVSECLRFYKLPPESVVVISDDLDLPPGKARTREGGGHGGHNGLRSIIEQLGTDAFRRVRIGIGRPAQKEQVTGYVLGNWTGEGAELGQKTVLRVADFLEKYTKHSRWSSTSLSVLPPQKKKTPPPPTEETGTLPPS